MSTLYSIIVIFLLLFLSSSCKTNQSKNTHTQQQLVLTQSQILDPVATLKSTSKVIGGNYHIIQTEKFNDSTTILRVYLSDHLANESLGVCNAFKSDQSYVFLYDSLNCKVDLPDSLTTSNANAPFMNDVLFWQVLAKRRGGQIEYFKVSFFESADDEQDLNFEDDPIH